MMIGFNRVLACLAVCLVMASLLPAAVRTSSTPAPPSVGDHACRAGYWEGREGEAVAEEIWLAPAGGLMLGLHRDTRPAGAAFYEFLRIEATPAGLAYLASPRGGEATPFVLKEAAGQRAVFENLEHDFPQRIIYWLDAEGLLHARVEGALAGGTPAQEWVWRKKAGW